MAEGLRLHLSSSSATGYMGVSKLPSSGRFQAQHWVGGRLVYLGSSDTAVEAAVAYARAVGQPPAVATEAEGMPLHLSSNSSTGYMGVSKLPSGRFRAQHSLGGKNRNLGSFDTAVAAAAAYASKVGEAASSGDVGRSQPWPSSSPASSSAPAPSATKSEAEQLADLDQGIRRFAESLKLVEAINKTIPFLVGEHALGPSHPNRPLHLARLDELAAKLETRRRPGRPR